MSRDKPEVYKVSGGISHTFKYGGTPKAPMGLDDVIPDYETGSKESPNKSGKWKDEDWLREQYITKDRSQQSIARECDVEKGTIRYWRNKFGIHKGRECPLCDHQSEALGNHFNQAGHGYPDISREKKEILVGMVMGDAWYDIRDGGYGGLGWEMKNLEFMKWLKDELEWIPSEPRVKRTAKEHAIDSLFRDNYGGSNVDNYNTTYSSYTVSHPWFDMLDWMDDDGKSFPEALDLTPMIVKIWYCCDGHLNWTEKGRPVAKITASSQIDQLDRLADELEEKIEHSSLEIPTRPKVSGDDLVFNVSETEALMDWMGEAPNGMEYKFCTESMEKYKRLKNE